MSDPGSASDGAEVDQQPDFDEFIEDTCGKLVAATRSSAFISPNDFALQTASSREFSSGLKAVSGRLLGLANKLVAYASAATPAGSSKRKAKVAFEDADDVVDRFKPVVDVIDDLLERTDTAIDVALGRRPAPGTSHIPAVPESSKVNPRDMHPDSRSRNKAARLDPKLYNAAHLMRPQLKFEDGIDNSNGTPAKIKIKSKPNAVVPLDLAAAASDPSFHAYRHEISNMSYAAHLFETVEEPTFIADMSETTFTFVETLPALEAMCLKLEKADEIAVDTENHSYRSFQGFICLIQVSTREEDFVVDAIALRAHLHVLNAVFTNPKIVKILHGADMDVQWLQRDFGVYLVGLFDTYHASHVLEMPSHSYAYLLKFYCDIDADKKYQLADWRIRPVPEEMMAYARSDTHYLHYIYDRMKMELMRLSREGSNQLLITTMERSAATALKIYVKDSYDFESGDGASGWRKALERHRGSLVPRQVAVYKRVHAWRDRVARNEDESQAYVLPNRLLAALAESIPGDEHALARICSPMPPLVRMRSAELLKEIKAGLEDAAEVARVQAESMARPQTPVVKPKEVGMELDVEASSEDEEAPAPKTAEKRKADEEPVVPKETPAAVEPKPKRRAAKIVLKGSVTAPSFKGKSSFFDGIDTSPKKPAIPAEILASLLPASPTLAPLSIEDNKEETPQVEAAKEPSPAPEPPKSVEKPKKPKFEIGDIQVDTMLAPKSAKKRKPEREIEPFDYSAVKSSALGLVLGEEPEKKQRWRAEPKFNMDEMEFEVAEDAETTTGLKKISKALKVDETVKHKTPFEPRAHLMPKSGSKSATFSGKKQI